MTTLQTSRPNLVSTPTLNPLWTQPIAFDIGSKRQNFTLTNFAGRCYPTLHDELMVRLCGINPGERVLDVGGGDAPFSRADVVTDAFLENNAHRTGRAVIRDAGKQFVECFAESLPFKDNEFDFAYCRMVLEHTTDPASACREMQRVAKRGFLETPSPISEYLGGHPTHRWIVWVEENTGVAPTLVFRRKPFIRAPFQYALRGKWFGNEEFRFRWEWQFRNIACTQLQWDGEFQFRVEEDPYGINYDSPEECAEAHLDAAINALRFGDVPANIVIPDTDHVIGLGCQAPIAHNTRGCALWLDRRYADAVASFKEAAMGEPRVSEFVGNSALAPDPTSALPKLVYLPQSEPSQTVTSSNFAGRLYPEAPAQLASMLEIKPEDSVILVSAHAASAPVAWRHVPERDVQGALPFADKQFNVSICKNVIQRAHDPITLCGEVQRIAERGFIELPSPLAEYFAGDAEDRWLGTWHQATRTLTLRPRPFGAGPFRNILTPLITTQSDMRDKFHNSFRNLSHIQIEWDSANPLNVVIERHEHVDANQTTDDSICDSLLMQSDDYLASGIPDLALNTAARAMRKQPKQREAYDRMVRAMEALRARGYRFRENREDRLKTDTAQNLNEEDDRWTEIYERVPLGEIPAHFSTFMSQPFLADFIAMALRLCPIGGRALETGVGYGYGAIWLSLHGIRSEGIDYAAPIVQRAEVINNRLGGGARFRYGDMFALDACTEGTYDLIYHQGVLEHFTDEEICEILRQQVKIAPRVLFSVPSANYPFEREFGNERLMTLEQWRSILEEFDIETLMYYGHPVHGGNEQIMGVIRGNAVSPKRSLKQETIVWNSPLREPCGYADEARHFVFALTDSGYRVACRAMKWNDRVAEIPPARRRQLAALIQNDISPGSLRICHTLANFFTRDSNARLNIGRTMFETDSLPAGWAQACNQMDAIWVPSDFNRRSFEKAGVESRKISVVPETTDFSIYDPSCAPLRISGMRGYNFLSVFDWTLRKGWDVLIQAFVEEFKSSEDVALVLKVHSGLGYTTSTLVRMITTFISDVLGRDTNTIPDLVLQDTTISEADMPGLYNASDCYVMPTRGEGWGRPLMEAMLMQLPVISTGWGGSTAFMTNDNSLLVDYTVTPVPEKGWRETPTYQGHNWAEPSVTDLKAHMRRAFEDRNSGRSLGLRARADIEQRFSYTSVVKIIEEELERRR